MLSQDELDKLLEEGMDEGAEAGEGEKEAPKEEAGAKDEAQSGEGAKEAQEDISWDDAFQEAAQGGDAAAQKALKEEGATVGAETEPPSKEPQPTGKAADFQDFGKEAKGAPVEHPDLDFILDIPLDVSVELGRTKLRIKDLLQLGQGSVVELNKLAGEPAEIYVNQKLMAKGEIVVVNEKFGVRLTEIISPSDRVKQLG